MASSTTVTDQITDSTTQAHVPVVARAPAVAMGNLYQAHAHALALALENAVHAQQQTAITAEAVTAASVALLRGVSRTEQSTAPTPPPPSSAPPAKASEGPRRPSKK